MESRFIEEMKANENRENIIDRLANLRSKKQKACARRDVLKQIENPESVEILYHYWIGWLDQEILKCESKLGIL